MPISKPFREQITPPSRNILSNFDERDFEKPIPEIELQSKFSFAHDKAILNQGSTDYCTAFASFSCFFDMLAGSNRSEFESVFNTVNAMNKARDQMSQMMLSFFKNLLRMEIWRFQGRNMRAALWHMNHGYTFPDRSKLMIEAYYRAKPHTPEDVCKYIQKYGSLFCGIFLREDDFHGYRLVNRGAIYGGHAIIIDGYNRKDEIFYATNSWGENWGRQGKFEIPFSLLRDIQEIWILEGCRFETSQK